jgi:hypothetical protein
MKKNIRHTWGVIFLSCAFLWALSSCANVNHRPGAVAQQDPSAEDKEPQSPRKPVQREKAGIPVVESQDFHVHTVRWHGETLSYIAKWYTGEFKNWRVLAKANPSLNPNSIHKGDRIAIPVSALKTRKPLPKNFMATLTLKKTKKSPTKSSRRSKKAEPPPLFGPKER